MHPESEYSGKTNDDHIIIKSGYGRNPYNSPNGASSFYLRIDNLVDSYRPGSEPGRLNETWWVTSSKWSNKYMDDQCMCDYSLYYNNFDKYSDNQCDGVYINEDLPAERMPYSKDNIGR